jgi:hypothetical protein
LQNKAKEAGLEQKDTEVELATLENGQEGEVEVVALIFTELLRTNHNQFLGKV